MTRPNRTLKLKDRRKQRVAVFAGSSIGKKYRRSNGRVLSIKINNELSPRGEAIKVKLEHERNELLRKTQSMDEKFTELLELVNSK